MTKAQNEAKARWNATHYRQVKVSVEPEIAAAFKAACESAGASMASVLSQFMAKYASIGAGQRGRKPGAADQVSTKSKRRKLVEAMTRQMELVRDAQEASMENIPENLRGAGAYDAAQESVDLMEEVIGLLEDIY